MDGDSFRKRLVAFHAVCAKHRRHGAEDTEPQSIFRQCVRRALRGKPANVPTTPEGWHLYSGDVVCAAAATEMNLAAMPCIEAAKQASEVYEYVMD